ncbi:hypothetical protein AB0M36_25150 [Actinoplanes sp. NPDC051346]|uniref:hypothetical protein n=1 Tax=Actinoplanes sp. NPDC051346 TaxID=3155048 RepID=UPI00343E6F9C
MPRTATIRIVASSVTEASAAGTVRNQVEIICDLRVDYPHKSSHVPGTVNVVGNVNCTAPVSAIYMAVGLARNGSLVSVTNYSNSGQASLRGNTATACVNGAYQGVESVTVVFPPGFTPPTASGTALSPGVSIVC